MKITKANMPEIEAAFAKSGKADRIVFDEDVRGFGIRMRRGSTRKVFIVQYEITGVQRRLTIGTTELFTPEQARAIARDKLAAARLGADPQQDKARERLKAKVTLKAIIAEHLKDKQSELRPTTMRERQRYLLQVWRPLHPLPLHKITRLDVASTLTDITKRGRVTAARARAALAAVFAWAIERGLIEANPVIGTRNPDPGTRRDRVLKDAELAAIWRALPAGDYGFIIKLLALTGQRREEVGGMSWSELDRDDGTWTIPAERVKNGRQHTITLPDMAWAIIADVPHRASNRDRMFGLTDKGYQNWNESKQVLDHKARVRGWTVHDLRRTAATGMADLGVQPHVIEAVLNHVSGHKRGVAGIYNRSSYEREVRNALAAWADHVRSVITGDERRIISFPQTERGSGAA